VILICPSILNVKREEIPWALDAIAGAADFLHLDIMDGRFVPATTFTLEESRQIIESSLLPVDVHLMVENPENVIGEFISMGARSITFHWEATDRPDRLIELIHSLGAEASMAIKPGTPYEPTSKYLAQLDMYLVMTVEPGAGGQPFMPEMLSKIRQVRNDIEEKKLNHIRLQVDGGINMETISLAVDAGADCCVAGSAVFSAGIPREKIAALRERVQR
jgi:ribulose-phosphate 3-epimerase